MKESFLLLKDICRVDESTSYGSDDVVDLGLSVKWASHNVGATNPEDYGGYYAWGETEEKSNYTWETYKYYADGKCTSIGTSICGTQYDVAHVKWGGKWRMPTPAEQNELVDKCTWAGTIVNGVKGMKVTGPNGNSIFLPAAGHYNGANVRNAGDFGHYWSGSLRERDEGSALGFSYDGSYENFAYDRSSRFQVRPVVSGPMALTGNAKEVTTNSAKITCSYKYLPANAQCGVIVTRSNSTFSLRASIRGSEGSYTFRLKNLQSGITYTYQAYISYKRKYYYGEEKSFTTLKKNTIVASPGDAIDLGLSVKWASCNVGASSPEGTGGYYAWGETKEKNYYDWSTYSTCHKISSICGTQYDVAHVKWADDWRMPTLAELKELKEKCTWEWTTQNGVKGMKVIGPSGKSIFLPAAGYRDGADVNSEGINGSYWSGSLDESNKDCAWNLCFYDLGNYYWGTDYLYYGCQVRPVVSGPMALTGNAKEVTTNSAKITCSYKYLPANAQCGVIVTSNSGTSSLQASILGSGGSYTFRLKNLQSGITYTYQAYILYQGKYYYGDEKSFTTLKKNDDVVTPGIVIDLGLSVKWASCNIGAFSPEGYGGYYAFGETKEKSKYDWSTYIYGAYYSCPNLDSSICGTQYDVAHVEWGCQWRMPTFAELEELVERCRWTRITLNGVKGMKVTGPNGNSIFLPAAGYRDGADVKSVGDIGRYWLGSLDARREYCAWHLGFSSNGGSYWGSLGLRYYGYQVRPVDGPLAPTGDANKVTYNSAKITCSYDNISADAQCGVIVTSSNGTSSLHVSIQGSKGSYTFSFENLQPGITYTYKAYIWYQGKYYYGDEKSFTTGVTSGNVIDLGLSVKWASHNVGAINPEDFGGYYAWGETQVKNNYDWSTYIHCDGTNSTCHNIGSSICGTQYDVAHVKWGGQWRMPTSAEVKELIHKCTWTWTTLNDVKGMKVTGPNGNSIFLPAAGDRYGGDVVSTGSDGSYWSGSLDEGHETYAWHLYFDSHGLYSWRSYSRGYGYQVRPVDGPLALTGDANKVTYNSAKITCSYDNISADAQCGVIVTSSNGTSSLHVSIQGSKGSYTFSFENLHPGIYTYKAYIWYQEKYYYGDEKSFTTGVTSGNVIDLGLSVKWASHNVGAINPEDFGGYYAWGETEEKSDYDWSTYIHCDGTYNTCHNIGSTICGTQYDVAHVKWGGQWRMPTHDELDELKEKCTWEWTTLNGVNGMKVTGPNCNSIFLPAAGGRYGGTFWSGSLNESREYCAWDLNFCSDGGSYWGSPGLRRDGFQVRPVSE